MRCACAIYECEKDDFGALRLRVRPRAKTLAPLARALGGDGSFSGLDAPHPRPSLPFERFALSSGRYAPSGPAAQARLPRSSTLLDAAPTSPTSLRSDGVTGVAALRVAGGALPPTAGTAPGGALLPLLWSLPLPPQVSASLVAPPKAQGLDAPAIGRKHARLNRPWGLTKAFAYGSLKTGARAPNRRTMTGSMAGLFAR